MRCGLCGFEFDEGEAPAACGACPFRRGCALIRCPRCGFETPPEPRWAARLRRARGTDEDQRAG
ncbi:MAG: hypothetical protein PHN82_01850 [bacterium]|nr:hypothetical protein [bacterium]